MRPRAANGLDMTTTRRTRLAMLAGVLALLVALPKAAHAAEAFYGVTNQNVLVTFASDAPGAVRSATPITGLQAGEQVLALDVRPLTGQLYALGSTSRLYVVSPLSGAARAVGDPFSPALAGTSFGFDFNPAADRIRLVSDGRQNLRLNPEDGSVAASDPALEYAAGDPGAGTNPSVGAAAHSGDGKVLYGLDSARDVLVAIDPPNDGKLKTVGPLGANLTEPASFDIAASGAAYAAGRTGGFVTLFGIDLAKGTMTAPARPVIGNAYGDVRAIAAAGPVPDDNTRPDVLVDVDREVRKTARLSVPLSCSEACEATVTLRRGGRTIGRAVVGLPEAGRTTLRVRLKRFPRLGAVSATLRMIAVDAAGNRRSLSRRIRFV